MLSRRQFLQAAGIAVAAAHLTRFASFESAPDFAPLYGRALAAAPVYAAPNDDARLITRLWPDSVTPILDTHGTWYRLPEGYAQREALQPMILPVRRSDAPAGPPFWGEVIGALAPVRAYCAADAPLLARVGHGGVLRVIDYLPDGWYSVAYADGALLGWTPSALWSPAQIDPVTPSLTLAVDAPAQRLTVFDGERLLLRAPISTGGNLTPGVYDLRERRETSPDNSSWVMCFGDDIDLAGVYGHNRFGAPVQHGAAVQVTPPLAKWLYPRAARIILS